MAVGVFTNIETQIKHFFLYHSSVCIIGVWRICVYNTRFGWCYAWHIDLGIKVRWYCLPKIFHTGRFDAKQILKKKTLATNTNCKRISIFHLFRTILPMVNWILNIPWNAMFRLTIIIVIVVIIIVGIQNLDAFYLPIPIFS